LIYGLNGVHSGSAVVKFAIHLLSDQYYCEATTVVHVKVDRLQHTEILQG